MSTISLVSLIKVDAQSIVNELEKLFGEKDLPWNNLISILMDSCNVIHGSKAGVETLIRDNFAPHLLDIDGDSCHHAHNASKKLCAPFGGVAERLFMDLFTDFKWSADQREVLQEICLLLNISYVKLPRYVPHRWLSVLDVATCTLTLMDAYVLFYSAFASQTKNVRSIKSEVANNKYQLSASARGRIETMTSNILKKKQTKEGKERKSRICSTLFEENTYLHLVLSFYTSALPLLKAYVCLFESLEPLVHLLYEKQQDLLLNFLACFITPECLLQVKKDGLGKTKIKDVELLQHTDMFMGNKAKKLVSKYPNSTVSKTFLQQVETAYVSCATVLKDKMPISNPVLKAIAFLDPQTAASKSLL